MSLDIVVELPLADKILYLILEFVTIIRVMSHVIVIVTIFVLVPFCFLSPYGEGSSKVDPSFISLKQLSSISV